jgi:cytochrome P450
MERIRGYGDAIAEFTDRMVDGWTDGETVAINEAFSRLTLQVLAHSLFDLDLGPGDPGVAAAVPARVHHLP